MLIFKTKLLYHLKADFFFFLVLLSMPKEHPLEQQDYVTFSEEAKGKKNVKTLEKQDSKLLFGNYLCT